ncbi:MAG: KPN_02809 family neutral zinc metallopeptidase [Brachybacterium sp.]|uniref:KPN_02809 family neutral zinc metallopeptidase n=1 Tax=Brachybacterium sp. Z12 TaxID=2759167 RepID=UPI001860DF85|nr:neutral zinc metallopeptidase [Brachybacterium sp. Z12]QNN82147.1 neutral zinc metallopeptidase [Brachybacterium sp. Z12]
MTFNPNAEIRSDNVSAGGGGGFRPRRGGGGGGRRGGGGLKLGGAGGAVLLVVVIIYTLMGNNPLDLLGGSSGQGPVAEGSSLDHCLTGADANEQDDCLVQATVESGDSLWERLGPEAGIDFVEAQGRVFSDTVQTGCGAATAEVGPFYCPADMTLYVDVSFFDSLSSQYGADDGQLAKMYVVAHEYGHHIQHLDGTMESADRSQTGPQSDGVRLELQADCYAGVWAHHAANTTDEDGNTMLLPLTAEDIESALSAASAVGDDHIQADVAGGQVQPETWTHGSSEQRRSWFTTGYEEGTIGACDTFSATEV